MFLLLIVLSYWPCRGGGLPQNLVRSLSMCTSQFIVLSGVCKVLALMHNSVNLVTHSSNAKMHGCSAMRQYTYTVIESVTVHMHSDRVSDSTHAQ